MFLLLALEENMSKSTLQDCINHNGNDHWDLVIPINWCILDGLVESRVVFPISMLYSIWWINTNSSLWIISQSARFFMQKRSGQCRYEFAWRQYTTCSSWKMAYAWKNFGFIVWTGKSAEGSCEGWTMDKFVLVGI